MNDSELLNRASELGRALFTQDDDLLVEAATRQKDGRLLFNGVIYAHQLRVSIGACVNDLEIITKAAEPNDLISAIIFLPLK